MESILAKVVCGIDKGQLGWAAKCNGALSQSRDLGNHVSDNVVEMHAVRPSARRNPTGMGARSEEHTSELQSRGHLVCRLLLEKKKKNKNNIEINDRTTTK